jgi:hypothetical protein
VRTHVCVCVINARLRRIEGKTRTRTHTHTHTHTHAHTHTRARAHTHTHYPPPPPTTITPAHLRCWAHRNESVELFCHNAFVTVGSCRTTATTTVRAPHWRSTERLPVCPVKVLGIEVTCADKQLHAQKHANKARSVSVSGFKWWRVHGKQASDCKRTLIRECARQYMQRGLWTKTCSVSARSPTSNPSARIQTALAPTPTQRGRNSLVSSAVAVVVVVDDDRDTDASVEHLTHGKTLSVRRSRVQVRRRTASEKRATGLNAFVQSLAYCHPCSW